MASVVPSTTTTTVAVPTKMRHVSPNLGAGVLRGEGTAGGVDCVGAAGVYAVSACVLSVDVSAIRVVFFKLVFVLDVLVALRVELVFQSVQTRGRHRDVV